MINALCDTNSLIYVHIVDNAEKCRVNGFILFDETTKSKEIGVLLAYPDNSCSEIIKIKVSKLRGKNTFDFLMDYEGDFDLFAINKVKELTLEKVNGFPTLINTSKTSLICVYEELCKYASNNLRDDEIIEKDGYYCIESKLFKSLITELDFGYTPLEVKKYLKLSKLLKVNSNRAYDYNVTKEGGITYKSVCFKAKGGTK